MAKKMLNVTIDGVKVSVEEGSTILDAAKVAGVKIPTLCYLKDLNPAGACRICLVEATGARGLVASCVYPVSEGMVVTTNSDRIRKARKMNLELLLSNHRKECSDCLMSRECKLKEYSEIYMANEKKYAGKKTQAEYDNSGACIIRDPSKCIVCKRCEKACQLLQSVSVIHANHRGFNTVIAPAYDKLMNQTACVGCGQCTLVCPTGALTEKDDTQKVFDALSNPELTVVVSPAPSVRVTLGEEFGYPIGTDVEGKMVSALRRLGFKYVFDVDFAADLTIMEEAHEFIDRVKNGGKLPMFTSCSPG